MALPDYYSQELKYTPVSAQFAEPGLNMIAQAALSFSAIYGEAMTYQPDHSGSHSSHMQGTSEDYQRLETMPFDPLELIVLEVARHFIVGFHHPTSHAWMDALAIAEDRLGLPYGPMIASHVLKVVNAVRLVRSAGFNYCNPNCVKCADFITKEERYLMTSLYSMRRDKRSDAHTQAMLLCQGGDGSNVIITLKNLVLSICDPAHVGARAVH